MMIDGPAAAIATPLPTNSPAPMMPPIVIIETCRGRNERLSVFSSVPFVVSALAAASVVLAGDIVILPSTPEYPCGSFTQKVGSAVGILAPRRSMMIGVVLAQVVENLSGFLVRHRSPEAFAH